MIGLLIALAVVALILVVPVMIGARMVGAEKTNFGAALLAVILLTVLAVIVQKLGFGPFVGFVVTAVVGAGLLAFLLGTTFWRGMAVSVIASVVQIGALLVLAGSFVAMAS